MVKIIRKVKNLLPMLLIAGLLTGCGGSKSYMADNGMADRDYAPQMNSSSAGVAADYNLNGDSIAESYTSDEASEDFSEETGNVEITDAEDGKDMLLEEKLVYRCDLEIETLDYAETMASIKNAVANHDGVIQSEAESDNSYNWYYEDYCKTNGTLHNYIEIRIPSKNYEAFVAAVGGTGKVVSKSSSIDNISQRYYDTTARIEALQIQEKNLLGMMEKCETIEDMITVEQRLSDIQYELGGLLTDKRYMDMDVAYSYVNINVEEVMEYRIGETPVKKNTFFDRLTNTIKSTGKNFLYFLESLLFLVIEMMPYIIIFGVIGWFVIKKFIRKRWKGFGGKKTAQKKENSAD